MRRSTFLAPALIGALALIVTSNGTVSSTATQPVNRMVLRELTIVDEQGRSRIRLNTDYGQPQFVLLDERGEKRCEIGMFVRGSGADEHGPGIYLSGEKLSRVVGLQLGRFDDQPSITVGSPGETAWIHITVENGGSGPTVRFLDAQNKTMTKIPKD